MIKGIWRFNAFVAIVVMAKGDVSGVMAIIMVVLLFFGAMIGWD